MEKFLKYGVSPINKKEYSRAYRLANKEKIKQYRKEYDSKWRREHKNEAQIKDKETYEKYKECILKTHKLYRIKNKAELKRKRRQYCIKNKEKIRKLQTDWIRNKRRTDIDFRLKGNISGRIWQSLKKNKKGVSWAKIVGFNIEQLRKHLESKFQPGMSWENYGEWEIDHIIPLSLFKFKDYNDPTIKTAWGLNNLQPLWAKENNSKGDRLFYYV